MKYEVIAPTSKCISYEVGDIIDLEKVGGVLKDQYGFIFDERYVKPVVNEWIPYDGKGQPVADDVEVVVQYKNYDGFLAEFTALARDCYWSFGTGIMAYKVVEEPKADKCTTTEKVYDKASDRAYHSDKNVEALRELLKTRAETGFKKYGVTTERKDLTTQQWCQHAIEELLDGAIYLMRLKDDLKAIGALVGGSQGLGDRK